MSSNQSHDDKNYIVIDENSLITKGDVDSLKQVKKPNEIGIIYDKDNKYISEITALIMILNQSSRNVQDKVDSLIDAGADPDLKIDYYGKPKCARDIVNLHRKHVKLD